MKSWYLGAPALIFVGFLHNIIHIAPENNLITLTTYVYPFVFGIISAFICMERIFTQFKTLSIVLYAAIGCAVAILSVFTNSFYLAYIMAALFGFSLICLFRGSLSTLFSSSHLTSRTFFVMFLFIAIGSSLAPLAIRRAISVGSIHQTVKNEDDLISLNFVHIHPTSYEVEDLTKINWEIISLHGLFCIFLCSIPIILHFVWSDRTYNEPTIKEFDFADKGQVSVGEGILVNLMVTALTTSDFLWMALTHHNVFDQRMHLGACLIPIGMVVLTRLFGLVFLPNITVTKYVIMGLFGFVVVYNAVTMLFIIKWYEEISTEGTINYSLFLILTPTSIISGLLPPLITTNLSKLISKNTSIFSENMIAANICSVFIANLIYNKDQVSLNLRVIPTLIDDYTKFILISLCCYVLIAVVPIKVMIKRINFKLKLTEQMMRGSKDEEEFLIEKL